MTAHYQTPGPDSRRRTPDCPLPVTACLGSRASPRPGAPPPDWPPPQGPGRRGWRRWPRVPAPRGINGSGERGRPLHGLRHHEAPSFRASCAARRRPHTRAHAAQEAGSRLTAPATSWPWPSSFSASSRQPGPAACVGSPEKERGSSEKRMCMPPAYPLMQTAHSPPAEGAQLPPASRAHPPPRRECGWTARQRELDRNATAAPGRRPRPPGRQRRSHRRAAPPRPGASRCQ